VRIRRSRGPAQCRPAGDLEDDVPKSKVRKKTAETSRERVTAQSAQSASRAKAAGPSSPIYIGIMLGLIVLGLVWLVVYYLWGPSIGFMNSLGNWNFAIGFSFMIVGLLMTMRWR
jgi:hypothetical protein